MQKGYRDMLNLPMRVMWRAAGEAEDYIHSYILGFNLHKPPSTPEATGS